jgi:gas vesicle protein
MCLYIKLNTMKTYNELLESAKSLIKDATHTKSKSSSDNSSVLIAAVIGLAAGAILGILFAPERGSETRANLSNSLGDLGNTVRDRAREGAGKVSDLKDKAVETVRSKVRGSEVEPQAEAGTGKA